jgi:hypothetical protein
METTAKVDLRKLQLLNDRINQTLDALNQLRVSVHGLQHSPAQMGYGVPGFGVSQMGYGQNVNSPIGSIGTPFIGQQGVLGHTGVYGSGIYGQGVQSPSVYGLPNVWGTQGAFGQSMSPYGISSQVPWANPFVGGLSHTQWDVQDPFVATNRAAQIFPFLFSPVSPVQGF